MREMWEIRRWRWGWHVTAARNIDSIMADGLQPYLLHKSYLPSTLKGIWVWKCPMEGESFAGAILQRLMDHRAWSVTVLQVLWRPWDTHPFGPDEWTINHFGDFQGTQPHRSWRYHDDVPVAIVMRPVPPARIRVVDTIDLGKLICGTTIDEGRSL